jgi:hypothetical protein
MSVDRVLGCCIRETSDNINYQNQSARQCGTKSTKSRSRRVLLSARHGLEGSKARLGR